MKKAAAQAIGEALGIILGDITLGTYLASFFFALLAILLSMWTQSLKRDKLSPETPYKFSWRFLIWDNTKRITAGMIVSFLLFRTSLSLFNESLTVPYAIGVGFFVSLGVDKAIQFLQNRFDLLTKDRTTFNTKDNGNTLET